MRRPSDLIDVGDDETPEKIRERALRTVVEAAEGDDAIFYRAGVAADGSLRMIDPSSQNGTLGKDFLDAAVTPEGTRLWNAVARKHLTRPGRHELDAFLEAEAIWPQGALRKTPVYREIFRPSRVADQIRLLVFQGDRFVGWIGAVRASGARPFARRDRRRMSSLVPPIRALLIAALERGPASAGCAQILVRPDGTVEHWTPAARSWLDRPGFGDALARAVRAVDRGEPLGALPCADAAITRLLGSGTSRYLVHLTPFAPLTSNPVTRELSAVQLRVAEFAASGATIHEIARALGRSPNTVRTHLHAAYERLDVANRVELARALEAGGRE